MLLSFLLFSSNFYVSVVSLSRSVCSSAQMTFATNVSVPLSPIVPVA